jgi:predicted enzyme related to lactoylglutathione lyase
MSDRDAYQAGVPCWVDTLVPDPAATMSFYGELLGWTFDGPGPGEYFVARLRGRDVAGVGAQPPGAPVAWNTYVSVASADRAAGAAAGAGGAVVAAPFDAAPAGRVAVLADPAGATVGVWEPRDHHGAQCVNEPSAWAMSMLHTHDPDACEAFYRDVFGWETDPFGPPGMKLFRLPGYVGGEPQQPVPRDVVAVMVPAADEDGPSHWSVGFWVGDADAVAEETTRLGGSVVAAPFDGGGMRQAIVADPAGAPFSVTTAPRH